MESRILKFETSAGRLWIAGTYGINKKPFNKKIIQEVVVKSEVADFVTLANNMSYSLRVSATLLRGLMLIYDKQWIYLESDLDNLYLRGRNETENKNNCNTLVRRNKGEKKNSLMTELVSINSSLSLNGDHLSNSSNIDRNGELILSLDADNFVLDLSNKSIDELDFENILFKGNGNNSNIGRIEDITLPEINRNKSKFSKEFGIENDFVSLGESNNEENEDESENIEGRISSDARGESQIVLWSSINNEDFMFQGEESEELLEQIERKKLNVERNKLMDRDNEHQLMEKTTEVVCEAQNRGENRKRPRCLSHLDIDLKFKGISSNNKNQLEMLVFNDEIIASMDERLRGWDSYKWWQTETQKNEKSQFLVKFQSLAIRSMRKSKRISVSNQDDRSLDKYGAIEKHRGEYDAGAEYSNVDLGFDHFNIDDDFSGSPSNRRFRNGRDTIESSVNYYGDGANSSGGARLQSGRESMIFSDSRRGSNTGVRLSTMLETGSVLSYSSSPFQFEKNLMGIQRDSNNSELQRIVRSGRLNGTIVSNGYDKNYRTNSIATSISDLFCMEEINSSNWSKSGITTSSGTYNLKTYTVQKFIATRMKEIREIRKINKENGYLIDNNTSNKENIGSHNREEKNSGTLNTEKNNINVESDDNEEEMSIYLSELLPEKTATKSTAAVFFYHLLVLATYNEIKLTQNTPGGNIKITTTSSFNEES
ncbi:N terminus of Rad21 / Rec8 like protein family protein [Cryptosporidium meleagridis]|uniref:N terminus of Rad21 / Rec8 like protein family protein n=1 Tax=Cryptosporidium meleagridis TaxID=93969 RepID=A0A2P4Z1B4_9CRYT|nr:N terminus of Rad21 / Rec8 like protein family protein [Cryptosporidium meleagridis]